MESENTTPNDILLLDEYIFFENSNVDEYSNVFNYEKEGMPLKITDTIEKCEDTQSSLDDVFDCDLPFDSSAIMFLRS